MRNFETEWRSDLKIQFSYTGISKIVLDTNLHTSSFSAAVLDFQKLETLCASQLSSSAMKNLFYVSFNCFISILLNLNYNVLLRLR